jgi:hypothetical protein
VDLIIGRGVASSIWAVIGGIAIGWALSGASSINNFTYEYVTAAWAGKDPDSTVIFTALEPIHVAVVRGVVNIPVPGSIGLYVVNDGMPCHAPATNNPNGKPVFYNPVFYNPAFDTNGAAGRVQAMTLNAANTAMTPGQSLCIIDTAQVAPDSRATLTVGLGP